MKFIADLHIHSSYSMATSSKLVPEMLDLWGRKKGIEVIGTGDAVHPGWLADLQKKLIPCGNGLFHLKKAFIQPEAGEYSSNPVNFLLSAEISCIYKKDGKVRKVHNLIFAPDFKDIVKIQTELEKIGNIRSDGRPILGLDSRDLLEIILNVNREAFLIPAHIWTPWFSVLGSKSGFDTIDECYGDLAEHVFAVETGLSSDPPMNWKCSFLDRYNLVSNSDAHSPENLGREANLFNTEMSYYSIRESLKSGAGFLGTIEYFPEEGKYHLDGHRKCGICWEPRETSKHKGICTVCGKDVTRGVLNRVNELSDVSGERKSRKRKAYRSLTPLKNVLAEIENTKAISKKVAAVYDDLLKTTGPELSILLELPIETIRKKNSRLADGIERLRSGNVKLTGGYDGEFGTVKVFAS